MITRDQAIDGITDVAKDTSVRKDAGIETGELTRVEIDGRKQYFTLCTDWSGYIACWISALIIFNGGLAIGVGTDFLNFDEMQWFITAVTVETFLQIVGMGYIAVKFLFSHK